MSSFNRITLMGRLGKDPEIRTTKGGKPVCNFSLATTEKRGNEETTTWFDVTAWDKTAEIVQKYVAKGHLLFVEGRMGCEDWTDKDGGKRKSWRVTADRVVLMPKASGLPQKAGQDHARAAAADEPDLDSVPF